MRLINAEGSRVTLYGVSLRVGPSLERIHKQKRAMIDCGELIAATVFVMRRKYKGAWDPAQVLTITQIGYDLSEKAVKQLLSDWLRPAGIADADWELTLQHHRPTSVAKLRLLQMKHVDAAVAFIKQRVREIREADKSAEQPSDGALHWRGPWKAPNPEVAEMNMVKGEKMLERFRRWISAFRPDEENLNRLEALCQQGSVLALGVKVWLDNVEKVTTVRVGFIDTTRLLISHVVSRPFTMMIFVGHENLFKEYSNQFSQELQDMLDDVGYTILRLDKKDKHDRAREIAVRFTMFCSMSDHAATKQLLNSKGGTSQSRDYHCAGSRAFVFGRVLCQGVCAFAIKDIQERWLRQEALDKALAELKGKRRPAERLALARRFHLHEAKYGVLVGAPLFSVAGELLLNVRLVPPQMHNGVFFAMQVMKMALNHLIWDGMRGYGELLKNYEHCVECHRTGTVAASAGTIRGYMHGMREKLYDEVRAEYIHGEGDTFKAGFASLFVLQQHLQILSYDIHSKNTVYRRLQLRVVSALLVLEMELAYWYFEGDGGRKRIRMQNRKKMNEEKEYKLETRRIYAADIGHNAVEFDHIHLPSADLTLAHLTEEHEERMQSETRQVAADQHNRYAVHAMLERELQNEAIKATVTMRQPVRSAWSWLTQQPEYFQPLAICSCLFKVSAVMSFNLNRLLTRVYRTRHYSHLVFFGAANTILFQCTAGPDNPSDIQKIPFVDLAADVQRTLDTYQRWVKMRHVRTAGHETDWKYDADAVTYFSFWFNSERVIRPTERDGLSAAASVDVNNNYKRGDSDMIADEESKANAASWVPAHIVCHCARAGADGKLLRTRVVEYPRAHVERRIHYVRIHDLCIEHWAAIKKARTICAMRQLLLCYEALETQRIAKRTAVFNALDKHYRTLKHRAQDTIDCLREKCTDALTRLRKATDALAVWRNRAETRKILGTRSWLERRPDGQPVTWERIEIPLRDLQQHIDRKRKFYAQRVCAGLEPSTWRTYKDWLAEFRGDIQAALQEEKRPDWLRYFHEENDEQKVGGGDEAAAAQQNGGRRKKKRPRQSARRLSQDEEKGKSDSEDDMEEDGKNRKNKKTQLSGAELLNVLTLITLLRKYRRWSRARVPAAAGRGQPQRLCDIPPPFLRYPEQDTLEWKAMVEEEVNKIMINIVNKKNAFIDEEE
jgi:hypothetical protein